MKTKAAVIGLGIGKAHAAVYAARDDVELAGLVDLDEAKLKEAAARTPAPVFTDVESMLQRARPDVVSICTPPHLHLPNARRCIEAGAHVLVEKPLAATAAECRELALLGGNADRVLMVAQKKRFIEPMVFLKRRIGDDWGSIRTASALYWLGRVELDWFWKNEQGGGPMVENSVHMVDALRFLIGEVRTVYAAGGNFFMPARAPVPDCAAVTLTFASGAVASLALGYGSEWGFATERLAFATEKATGELSGRFDAPVLLRWAPRGAPGEGEKKEFASPPGFPEEIEAFLKAVRGEAPNPVTASDAARSIDVCLAIRESIRTQAPVAVG